MPWNAPGPGAEAVELLLGQRDRRHRVDDVANPSRGGLARLDGGHVDVVLGDVGWQGRDDRAEAVDADDVRILELERRPHDAEDLEGFRPELG